MSAGIYVHVPFCLTRCGYCDFNAYAGLDHLAPSYVDALVAEAELHAADWSAETIDTIDRKSTRLNSSHMSESRMPSSA